MLSRQAIEEFKQLYYKEHQIKLTDAQAVDIGTRLIGLIKLVYGPAVPKKWIYKVDREKIKK